MRKFAFLFILLGGFNTFLLKAQDLTEIVLSNQFLVLCEKSESFQLNISYVSELDFPPIPEWKSTNPDVVYVDQNGMVTPLKPGTSKVIATVDYNDATYSDTCDVHVGIDPTGKKLIIQKWNNTLILNNNPETNGGYQFLPNKFQWYADGTAILNATGQSYSAGQNEFLDPNIKYAVSMSDMNGNPLSTCPALINPIKTPMLSVYPNPVTKSQSLQIELNLPEEIQKEGEIQVYTVQGVLVNKFPFNKQLITIDAPATSGHYILRVKVGGHEDMEHKIWVK